MFGHGARLDERSEDRFQKLTVLPAAGCVDQCFECLHNLNQKAQW